MGRARGAVSVMWTIQTCGILCACGGILAACVFLKFVMVPLIMAYFVTFLMAPITDVMEKRPYQCWVPYYSKMPKNPSEAERAYKMRLWCEGGFEHPKRVALVQKILARGPYEPPDHSDVQLSLTNCVLMGKFPHSLACLLTLVIFFGGLGLLFGMVHASFRTFAEKEAKMEALPDKMSMQDELVLLANDFVENLESNYSLTILREKRCEPIEEDITVTQVTDINDNYVLNVMVYGFHAGESGIGEYTQPCIDLNVFGSSQGTPLVDLIRYVSVVSVILNDVILILLLGVFIIMERPEGSTFGGQSRIAVQMEAMVKMYISLKTALSGTTGILVGIFLQVCGVQLASVFGLLAFLLNYVPTVGSMIATILPIPIIILDDDMSVLMKSLAIFLPSCVQMYVGNFLEPAVFGTALNLTAISVLLSLVFFSYIWGIYGAVLSVPLLGAFKIVMHNSVHPLSESALRLIREDADIDIEKDLELDDYFDRMDREQKRINVIFGTNLMNEDILGFVMAHQTPEDHQAATRIAAIHRGKYARQKMDEQHKAAKKLQAVERGRVQRKRLALAQDEMSFT